MQRITYADSGGASLLMALGTRVQVSRPCRLVGFPACDTTYRAT